MSKATCTICSKPKSGYILNNKLVCLRCDELMFDLEIELDEIEVKVPARKDAPGSQPAKVIPLKK